jgi:hypothetical protein
MLLLALEFDPDRFIDERLNKYLTPNPYIFLPFNAGKSQRPSLLENLHQCVLNRAQDLSRTTIRIQRIFVLPHSSFTIVLLFQSRERCAALGFATSCRVENSYRSGCRGRDRVEESFDYVCEGTGLLSMILLCDDLSNSFKSVKGGLWVRMTEAKETETV